MAVEVPDYARCSSSGYLLRGLPEPVCPECGQAFVPGDASTYIDPAARRRRREPRPMEPLSKDELILSAVFLAATSLWGLSIYSSIEFAGAACVSVVLYAMLLIRWLLILSAWQRRRELGRRDLTAAFDAHVRRWRINTLLIVLGLIGTQTPLLVHVHFWISRPFLEYQIWRWETDPRHEPRFEWVGLEYVRKMSGGRGLNYVRFELAHYDAYSYGLARYSSAPPPAWEGNPDRVRLTWSWYVERW